MSQQRGPVLSVVDYDAWRKGYTPPSEHVLIDQLAYRGARVVLSSDMGEYAYWVVMRSDRPHGKMLPVMKALELAMHNDQENELEARASLLNTPSQEGCADAEAGGPVPSPLTHQ